MKRSSGNLFCFPERATWEYFSWNVRSNNFELWNEDVKFVYMKKSGKFKMVVERRASDIYFFERSLKVYLS